MEGVDGGEEKGSRKAKYEVCVYNISIKMSVNAYWNPEKHDAVSAEVWK